MTAELYLPALPDERRVTLALAPFGRLSPWRSPGVYRLIEGDEDPEESVWVTIVEQSRQDQDPIVASALPWARYAVQLKAVASGSRGFWLARVTLHLQRELGGAVWVPGEDRVYITPDEYEHSWPAEHGGHN